MTRVKDRSNFPVKLAAERTVMHVLQVHIDPSTLEQYLQTLDNTTARTISDYCKRVLTKLPPDSESESSEEDQT
jgi:hypothetical protein